MDGMIECSWVSIVVGCILIALPSRAFPPVLIAAIFSILAGGFTLDLKLWRVGVPQGAMSAISMIWFALWVLAIPALLVTLVALALLARRQRRFLVHSALVLCALVATTVNAVNFWQAAAMGVALAPKNQMHTQVGGGDAEEAA